MSRNRHANGFKFVRDCIDSIYPLDLEVSETDKLSDLGVGGTLDKYDICRLLSDELGVDFDFDICENWDTVGDVVEFYVKNDK